jgi:drug/metabolite transporter (DMT)-like permease
MRSFVALWLVVMILWYTGISPFGIGKRTMFFLGIRCLCGFTGFAIEFFSAKYTDLSKIVIILYNPFLTSIMSYLIIGETVSRHDLLSFLLGVVGIAFLTDPFEHLKGIDDLIGISLALLTAVIFNIGFISLRHVKKDFDAW